MDKEYPSKFKVKLNPRKLDDGLLPGPIELEARVFFISEYEKLKYTLVTDEINFPYNLLYCPFRNLNVESGIDKLCLNYLGGEIRFFNASAWSDLATGRFSNEGSVKYFREGDKVLKGNTEILKKYDVSIQSFFS